MSFVNDLIAKNNTFVLNGAIIFSILIFNKVINKKTDADSQVLSNFLTFVIIK
jgi:hypothetical protein